MGKISNLFINLLEKDFKRTKTLTNKKPTNKTKITVRKNYKGDNFLRAQTPKGVEVACFAFGAFFLHLKSFRNKKKNRFEIFLVTSITYATV